MTYVSAPNAVVGQAITATAYPENALNINDVWCNGLITTGIQTTPITCTGPGLFTVVPAAAGLQVRVLGFYLGGFTSGTAMFYDTQTVAVTGPMGFATVGAINPSYQPWGQFETTAGVGVALSVALGNIGGYMQFIKHG